MRIIQTFLLVIIQAITIAASAQTPQVPHKMQFAGMTLTIRDDARREIQKDVDALTLSPKHFAIKAERAKTYFPIIEKIFEEERVPVDFKYLVLQESALIPDAVSPSNAVGFWQFKDFTAIEMGLRVDKQIDERMNIVSASRGAAKYFKKNNFYFNNWLYALQAYQMGAGAVLKSVKDSESGASHMEITSHTYWYVKKYLAHKIAFEQVSGLGQVQVSLYENKTKKSVSELATEMAVEEEILKGYNKWIRSGVIPDDRTYAVLIPRAESGDQLQTSSTLVQTNMGVMASSILASASIASTGTTQPIKINGLLTIIAIEGETTSQIAARAGITLSEFLVWNDMSISDPLQKGQVYFVSKKRSRATEAYHKVGINEDLWMVSQKYGVQLKKLKKYNRIAEGMGIKEGETLWLSSKRPKDARSFVAITDVAEVDHAQAFNWSVDPVVQEATPQKKDTVVLVESKADEIVIQPDLEIKSDSLVEKTEKPDSTLVIKNEQPINQVLMPIADSAKKDSTFTIKVKKTQHVVQAGETLYSIARENEVGVMDLVNWNGLNLQEGIRPGQILKLFDSQEVAKSESKIGSEIVHEVKSSETLYSVARKYGVTIKELMDWNNKKDFGVSVGDKLRIIRK